MVDILIFGTGVVSDILFDHYIDHSRVRIHAFINSDNTPVKEKRGIDVISENEIGDYSYDFILIAADVFDSIKSQCINAGVPESKIIGSVFYDSNHYPGIIERANNEIVDLLNLRHAGDIFKRALPGIDAAYYLVGNELFLDGFCATDIPSRVDPVRLHTLHALAREISFNDVEGSVAELGVFKGDFAKLINEFFPDRTFYLFDTFEGFSEKDTEYDVEKNYSQPSSFFQDTSVELVLSKMPHRQMCKVVKGYFPESTAEVDETFSFVSIDTDLYLPIYNGLHYFYERLSKNGYILVHDFNHRYYSGAREAVIRFCKEKGVSYCPVADSAGSAIITK